MLMKNTCPFLWQHLYIFNREFTHCKYHRGPPVAGNSSYQLPNMADVVRTCTGKTLIHYFKPHTSSPFSFSILIIYYVVKCPKPVVIDCAVFVYGVQIIFGRQLVAHVDKHLGSWYLWKRQLVAAVKMEMVAGTCYKVDSATVKCGRYQSVLMALLGPLGSLPYLNEDVITQQIC